MKLTPSLEENTFQDMDVADIDDTISDLDSFIKRHADKLVLPEDRTK